MPRPSAERWDEVWAAFHRILEGPSEARASELEALAGVDLDLAAEVADLLAAHGEPLPILDEPTRPSAAGAVPTGPDQESADSDWKDLPPGAIVAERFEILRHLDSGGMGQVYQAHDRRLKRTVGLKLVRSSDPALTRRFLREAEMQARIDHGHVCPIYEAGTSRGRPFIAMRYVDGMSLGEAAATMLLEEKLLVGAKVARALHAAHREGLVHRDVKPSNVMLERDEDEGWHPFVLDFGLARVQESPNLTRTGTAVGTPAYMAPEQATSSSETLDRRTDVWGLGATLYDALAGAPPHGKVSGLEALARLLRDDPHPLRRVAPSVPADVETIVMKCLERDPARRYPSARAVAEDLERYLDGEPIEARPAGLLYRLSKRVRKNRAVVAAGLVALVTVVASLAMLAVSRRQAAREATLARRFGIEVDVAERILRHAYTAPLHDVRPERERVRQRLAAIQASRDSGDQLESRLASYALGRAHLALREAEPARAELKRAWDAGYREREVAHALGLSFAALYQDGLLALERLPDPEQRAARREEIDRAYRTPALESLRRAEGLETESPLLLEALLAYLDGLPEDALELANRAWEEKGWIYEARILEGDVRRDLAERAWTAGDYENAATMYEQARDSYEETTEIARSDPLLLSRICQLDLSVLVFTMIGREHSAGPLRDRGAESCARALAADPAGLEAGRALPEIHWRFAAIEERRGRGPGELHERARQAAENQLAISARIRGHFEMTHGTDPGPSLDRAIAAATRALELDPGFAAAFNTLGGALKARAEQAVRLGDDPRALLERAVAAYGRARHLDPKFVSPALNAAGCDLVRGAWELENDLDPSETLDSADQTLAAILDENPRYVPARRYRGQVALLRARRERSIGADPRPALAAAIEAFEDVLAINPEHADAWSVLGEALTDRASLALESSRDPTTDLSAAGEAFARAQALGYRQLELWRGRVRILLLEARWAAARGEDPTRARTAAAALAADARDRFPGALDWGAADDPLAALQAAVHPKPDEAGR
jgi:serine/threonine-protein kinase